MPCRRPEPLGGQHRLDQFECGEPALDEWLKRQARPAHPSDPARALRTTLEDGQPRSRLVPAVLLARLAVDRQHQGTGIGRSLLQDVLLRCVEAADAIGARVLLVHAKHERAKSWYLQYGFEESPTDPLHLQMLMKDVRAFLAGRGVT